MSECPSHCCTVLRSTPAHRQRVANVERNLCSQKSSLSSLARSAHFFRQSRKSSFGLQPEVGKTNPHVFSDFAFHAFSFLRELRRDGNLAFLVCLRRPSPIRLVANPDG